jgi:hypothetical protein
MELVKFRNNWNGNSYKTMELIDFVNALTTCIEDKKMYGDNEETDFYEYTGNNDSVVCAYFDYDEYISKEIWDTLYEKNGDEYGYEKYENEIKDSVKQWFGYADCATMRNHRIVKGKDGEKYKFSYRLNFYNVVCYKHELKEMVSHIKNKVHALDTGVYDPHRKMRCVNTAKPDTPNEPMQLVEGTIEQTLIQYYSNKSYDMYRLTDFCSYNEIDYKPYFENKKNETNLKEEDGSTTDETMSVITEPESISDLGDMDLTKYEDMGDIDLQLSILEPCFQKGQYKNWMKIGCILKKTLPYEDAVSYFIEHSYIAPFDNEADKQKNIDMFNSWNTNNGYTKKSLMKMCKDINKDLTFKLFLYENFNGYVKDATDVSQLVEKIQDTIIRNTRFDGKEWYCLNDKNLWLIADPETNITNEVLRYIDYNKNYIDELFRFTDSQNEKKIFTNQLTALLKFRISITNSTSITNKIKKMLSSSILDKNFALNLDAKKDIWAFKNGVLNLKNGAFRRGFRSDDYLTTHLDFDYNKKFDETKLANLKEQFKKVLNYNDEHLNYFMSIIGACMTGNADKLKEMYFGVDGCDGIGNNGKTNTLTIFNMIFNCYIYKTNKTFLEASNTKSHKQLVMMKGKRIVWADEWGKGLPNYELLKIIADGTNCENEVMYGTSEGILIMFKMFILTNHTPNLSSDEDAVYNRFRQITFGSHFDTQGITIKEDYEKLQFTADVNMRDNIVNNYKNEMIAWVLEYSKKFLIEYKLPPIPEKFVNDTKETKNANDKFKTIIDENYERCDVDDENECVSVYELMDRSGIKNNKTIISKMKQIGFPTRYDKNKMKNRKRGIFYGIREKIDEE